MPKLLVFAPCEKVIISQDENNPTLIALLTDFGGEFQGDAVIDKKSVAPMRWSIFSLWLSEAGDELQYEQTIHLISPAGEIVLNGKLDLDLTKRTSRAVAHLGTMPIGQPGEWWLKLYVHKKGEAIPKEPEATYPLNIRLIRSGVGSA